MQSMSSLRVLFFHWTKWVQEKTHIFPSLVNYKLNETSTEKPKVVFIHKKQFEKDTKREGKNTQPPATHTAKLVFINAKLLRYTDDDSQNQKKKVNETITKKLNHFVTR